MVKFRHHTIATQLGLPGVPTADKVLIVTQFAEAELKDMIAHGEGANHLAKSTAAASDAEGTEGQKGQDACNPTASDHSQEERSCLMQEFR